MPGSRPPSLSWPVIFTCGPFAIYGAVVAALASVGGPLPPPQLNSVVAGAFAASIVVAAVRARPIACGCSTALAEMRQELQELREQVAQPVYMVPAPKQSEEPREGLGPQAIDALRRMDRRLGSVE